MDIAKISAQRYACKAYDSSKAIAPELMEQLVTVLRNSPSSVNIQPWHFIVAQTKQSKELIAQSALGPNQEKIIDCSHVIVFCNTIVDQQHLAKLTQQETSDLRFANQQERDAQHTKRQQNFERHNKTIQDKHLWEEKQIYLALGTLLLAAATLNIDATPIEGFSAQSLDQSLQLQQKKLRSVVLVTLGYRSEQDFNAKLAKSRLPIDEIFSFI